MESMGEPIAGEVELGSKQRDDWTRYVLGGWALHNEMRKRMTAISKLSTAEWRVLEVLSAVPSMQISGLAEATQLGISTVSRQVARSIAAGYVSMVESPGTDGRQKWVAITDLGREAVAPALQIRDEVIAELVLEEMTEDELAWLGEAFDRIRLRCHS